MSVIKSTDCHPDADWIYREVKKTMPKISLATVYRNLKELVGLGLVSTVETEDKTLRYDGTTSPHIHFVCKRCGKIIDIFKPSGLSSAAAFAGMSIETEKIVLYGKCRECNLGEIICQRRVEE